MPNRSRKQRLPDLNATATGIIQVIGSEPAPTPPADGKDPAAVALGRKGGLIGGKARAAKMTAKQRSDSARKAAKARWARKEKG